MGTHRLSPVDSIGGPMSAAWCAVGKNAMNELARQVCQDSKGKTRAKSFADFEWAVQESYWVRGSRERGKAV